jgi:hypothetical protein
MPGPALIHTTHDWYSVADWAFASAHSDVPFWDTRRNGRSYTRFGVAHGAIVAICLGRCNRGR